MLQLISILRYDSSVLPTVVKAIESFFTNSDELIVEANIQFYQVHSSLTSFHSFQGTCAKQFYEHGFTKGNSKAFEDGNSSTGKSKEASGKLCKGSN